MFKLGFAFLFAVFFACNCYENSQAEDPAEKQDDVISEGAGDGFAENNDAVDNDDEPSRGESKEGTAEERDDNGEFRDDSKKKG